MPLAGTQASHGSVSISHTRKDGWLTAIIGLATDSACITRKSKDTSREIVSTASIAISPAYGIAKICTLAIAISIDGRARC